jgi:hypothetical protein
MLLENKLATNPRCAAGFGGVAEGVLTAPQPTSNTGRKRVRIEGAIFLKDMPILLVEICAPESAKLLRLN